MAPHGLWAVPHVFRIIGKGNGFMYKAAVIGLGKIGLTFVPYRGSSASHTMAMWSVGGPVAVAE